MFICLCILIGCLTIPIETAQEQGFHQKIFTQSFNEFQDELPPPSSQWWYLVWSDEFDKGKLNTANWKIEHAALIKNEELQFYAKDHVKVMNGMLQLKTTDIPQNGRLYSSGAVHTLNKRHFLYGKLEVRARLPQGQGLLPAIWLLTADEQTWLPEIDIVEVLGHKTDEAWMVYHYLNEHQQLESVNNKFVNGDFSAAFHVFTIEWTPDSIVWLIDHKPRFQITSNIPDEPMYLYLNTAVGGVWPGNPDATTSFPAYFLIDYVRLYKKVACKQC